MSFTSQCVISCHTKNTVLYTLLYTLLNNHAIASVKSLLHSQTVYTHFVMIVTDDDANDCGPVAPFKIDMFQGSCFQ